MKFSSLASLSLTAVCSLMTSEGANLRRLPQRRSLQANGADIICIYIRRPDGTRIPVISPCVDPNASATAGVQVGDTDTDPSADDRSIITGTTGTATSSSTASATTLLDIVSTAVDAGTFTKLVDLVETAGLVDALSEDGPFTVFAPTNDAFPEGAAYAALKADPDALARILAKHVVPGTVPASDLANGVTLKSSQGDVLTITADDDGTFDVDNASILRADIAASNGIIHVIDEVLLPN